MAKARRQTALLNVLVDMKVGVQADIVNIIKRLDVQCSDTSGEDVKIVDVKVLDRKLLIEGE